MLPQHDPFVLVYHEEMFFTIRLYMTNPLRKSRKRYLQFYKAEDIADRDIRPYRPDFDWEW